MGSGRRPCWSRGRRIRTGGTRGSGMRSASVFDVPVPQMWEQLPNIVQFFAAQLPVVAEPVIEVPKILLDRTPQRLGTVCVNRRRRNSWWKCRRSFPIPRLQRIVEQNVDIPVQRGGGGGSLQGLRPGQGSTARKVEHTVDTPAVVVVWLVMAAFKVSPRDRVQQRFVEQIPLSFRRLRRGLPGSLPGQGSAAFSCRQLPSCSRDSLRWLLEEFLAFFYVKAHTNPEVDSPFAFENLDFFDEPPCIWQSLVPDASVQELLYEFHAFST